MTAIPNPLVIDHRKCTRCGACVRICPKRVLTLDTTEVTVTDPDACMLCTHCYAVCARDAIRFEGGTVREPLFRSFRYERKKRSAPPIGDIVDYFRSRRSCRSFTDKVPGEDELRDLVEFAVTAPSASNCQLWEFTVVRGREKVWSVAEAIGVFFTALNRLVRNPFLRYLSFFFTGMQLIRYYRDKYESVEFALQEAARGRDLLFHGASAIIIVHGLSEGSLPLEDGQYAAYNMTLLAPAMKLGTCFIGYASETMNRSGGVRRAAGIPDNHRVFAVIAVGYPDPGVRFQRNALRKKYPVNVI